MYKKLLFILVLLGVSFGLSVRAAEPETMQCSCTCQRSATTEAEVIEDIPLVLSYNYHDLIISEVYPSPNTGEKEWVEIYNATGETIDLTDWQLTEGSGSVTSLTEEILPGEYRIFYKSSLNNSGDQLVLRDSVGTLIDQLSYGDFDDGFSADNAPAPRKGESIIRLDLENSYDIDFQDYDITLETTLGAVNIYTPAIEVGGDEESEPIMEVVPELVEEIPISPTTLRITELLPNPSGADTGFEWIELYNYGEADVNLQGWKLDDMEGGSTPYIFSENLILRPREYYLASNEVTKISLNNDADEARLLDTTGNLIDSVSYMDCQENFSYAKNSEVWSWVENITPGSDNETVASEVESLVMKSPSRTTATTLAVATKSSTSKSKATSSSASKSSSEQVMAGNISALPGVVSAKTLYLDNGLEIYNSSFEWPDLAQGDYLSARGKLSSDGRRLTVAAVSNLQVNNDKFHEVESVALTAEELSHEYMGKLVSLEGEIVAKKSNVITLSDDTGEFALYRYTQNKAINFDYKVGDRISVVGLARDFSGQLRLIPRSTADLQVITTPPVPSTDSPPAKSSAYGKWVSWLLLAGVVGWVIYKKRLEISQRMKDSITFVRDRWQNFRKARSC